MPEGVLAEIMRAAGQRARAQSMLASRALHAAATAPGVWESVTFTDLDQTAVRFMLQHRCPRVAVTTSVPDDLSWFLGRLAQQGADDCIVDLRLDVGPVLRLPSDLLAAVARHRALREFALFVDECEIACELAFPRTAQLLDLREMTIVDSSTDTKNVMVWFNGSQSRFPALEALHLDVGLSDVMAGLCHMPRLRELVYHFDGDEGGETYEDACLRGANLDVLDIMVNNDTCTNHLFLQIELCSVRKLVLQLHDDYLDLTHPLSPALEELALGIHAHQAEVALDFPSLAALPRLRRVAVAITSGWLLTNSHLLETACSCLVFQHAGTIKNWMALFGGSRARLELPASTRVCICPAAGFV